MGSEDDGGTIYYPSLQPDVVFPDRIVVTKYQLHCILFNCVAIKDNSFHVKVIEVLLHIKAIMRFLKTNYASARCMGPPDKYTAWKQCRINVMRWHYIQKLLLLSNDIICPQENSVSASRCLIFLLTCVFVL